MCHRAALLSYALSDVGDLTRAEGVLEEALAQADQVTDPYTRVRLYWSLARLNEIRNQPAAALGHIRRAIALLEVTEDTLHLARAHLLCGTIMISQGKAQEAGDQFAAAERMFGPKPDPLDLANLRADQARRAALLNRPEEAERLAREALSAQSAATILSVGRAHSQSHVWFSAAGRERSRSARLSRAICGSGSTASSRDSG